MAAIAEPAQLFTADGRFAGPGWGYGLCAAAGNDCALCASPRRNGAWPIAIFCHSNGDGWLCAGVIGTESAQSPYEAGR